MHPDGKSDDIGYKDNPTVAVYGVGFVLPSQNHPKDHGSEERGESIHFALDGTEPKGVAEGVDQRACHSGA